MELDIDQNESENQNQAPKDITYVITIPQWQLMPDGNVGILPIEKNPMRITLNLIGSKLLMMVQMKTDKGRETNPAYVIPLTSDSLEQLLNSLEIFRVMAKSFDHRFPNPSMIYSPCPNPFAIGDMIQALKIQELGNDADPWSLGWEETQLRNDQTGSLRWGWIRTFDGKLQPDYGSGWYSDDQSKSDWQED